MGIKLLEHVVFEVIRIGGDVKHLTAKRALSLMKGRMQIAMGGD